MLDKILRIISRLIYKYSGRIILLFALLTIISFFVALRMQINSDIIDVLPSSNKTVEDFKGFVRSYGNVMDTVTVMVVADNGSIHDYLYLVDTIAEKLKKSSGVESIEYNVAAIKSGFYLKRFPFFLDDIGLKQLDARLTPEGIERQMRQNVQWLSSPIAPPFAGDLITIDPLNISGIVIPSLKRSDVNRGLDLSSGYYLTSDNSTALIILKLKGKSKDIAFVKALKKSIDEAVSKSLVEAGSPADVKIEVSGAHILLEEVRSVLQEDIIGSTVMSVVLIFVLVWLAYRVTLRVLVSIAFTMFSSLAFTMASAYLLFGSLNIVTSVVAALLIGLYADYSILVVQRYRNEIKTNGKSVEDAITTVVTKIGSAITIAALTTSFSFFTIVITRFEGLYELGIVCGIGVVICLITNIFLLGSLLVWISKKGTEKMFLLHERSMGVERLSQLVKFRPANLALCLIVVIVVLAVGVVMIKFDNNPDHIGISDNRSMNAIKLLNAKLDRSADPVHFIIKETPGQDILATYDMLEKLLRKWKLDGTIKHYDSLSVFLPPASRQDKVLLRLQDLSVNNKNLGHLEAVSIAALEKNGITYDKEYIKKYLGQIRQAVLNPGSFGLDALDLLADSRVSNYYNKDARTIAAHAYPSTQWDKSLLDSILKETASIKGVTVTGKALLFREVKQSIIYGSSIALLAALAFNLGIVWWYFRKMRYVVIAMVPVVVGLLLTVGIMGYTGTPFNFINVGALAIICGFGVDYGVYIVQAYLKEDKKDISSALRLSGKNIIMCSATTVAGCGSIITAKFAGIASIGFVLTVGAAMCALVTLFVVPCILKLFEPEDEKI